MRRYGAAQHSGLAMLEKVAQQHPRWRRSRSQDGDRAMLNAAAGPLSRWRLYVGHKMARRGPSSPQTAPVLRLRPTRPRLRSAIWRGALRPGDTGAGAGGAGGGRAASGSGGAASVAVAARRTDARAPDVARRHGGRGGAAAGPGPGPAVRGSRRLPPLPPPL